MPSYDSDSSGGEDNDYEETNVLLGYASSDANGEEISRLGGRPEWLDPSKPPSAALARCKVCKDLMVLLLQLNAELPDRFPGHERRLYILSCRKKSCRRQEGSIRAIRGLRVSPEAVTAAAAVKEEAKKPKEAPAPPKAASAGLGEALFGVKPATSGSANPFVAGGNPFASKSSSSSATAAAAPANPFAAPAPAPASTPAEAPKAASPAAKEEVEKATKDLPKTFAETLSLNTTPPAPPAAEPWPEESAQPTPYPVRWLADAEYETLDPEPTPVHANTQVLDMDSSEGGGSGGGKEDKEVFESTMDSVFQKFADRVGQNPEQCIRYEFAGQPLLYSKSDAVGKVLHASSEKVGPVRGIPRCGNCGAGRVFEVQLTPHAIQELEIGEDGMDGMDWGTVIVGVCERDCQQRFAQDGEAGYVEEWAGVQWEELSVKR